ncbi:MAG: type II secretion system F family protein, partial [Candidatus Paceibacterota bacterium]
FYYKAIRPDNRMVEGETEGQTTNDALAFIASQGLRPIIIKPIKTSGINLKYLTGQKITLEDKVFLTKYLSLMLKVGTDLFKAIDILVEDFDKPAVKSFLLEVRANLEKGQPFYTTFAKYPKTFSQVFVNLIKAGEVSGNLENVFEQLSVSLEKEKELTGKIKASLTYPVILFFTSILILVLLVSFSLPKIANVFLSGGMKPPTFSRIVFTVGLFVGDNLVWLLLLLAAFFIGGGYFFLKTLPGRKIMFDIALKTPVIRKVIHQIALQRFATTLSSLLSSGLPILDAIEITAESVALPELKNAMMRISREGISKGLTVGEAFKKEPIFPKVVSNLIAVSEKSGHIESILLTLGDFYSNEIEGGVKSLVAFIEPIMLMLIGIVVGTIALAVIVPVYQLTSSF